MAFPEPKSSVSKGENIFKHYFLNSKAREKEIKFHGQHNCKSR